MRVAVMGWALVVLCAASAAASPCKSDEVPYPASGCDGEPQTQCWPQRVRPTPVPWCTCEGRTVDSSLPGTRWRFAGACESSVGLFHVGKVAAGTDAPETLYFVGSRYRAAVGPYSRCEERPVHAPVLAAARCWGKAQAADDVRVQRKEAAVVVTVAEVGAQAPAREVLRMPSPIAQRLVPAPFSVYTPPPPRPAVVRFDNLKDQKSGAPPGRRTLILDIDRAWYEVGRFDRCAEGRPRAPALLEARCDEGGHAHVLSLSRQGPDLVVSDAVDGTPARERLRAPLRNTELELAPMLRD